MILKDYMGGGEERSEDERTCELAFASVIECTVGTRGTVTKKPTLPQGTRTTIFETEGQFGTTTSPPCTLNNVYVPYVSTCMRVRRRKAGIKALARK